MAKEPDFVFKSDAYPNQQVLRICSFKGSEAMSELFRFELELVSEKPDLDLEKMLKEPASLEIRVPVSVTLGSAAGLSGSIHQREPQVLKSSRYIKRRGVLESLEQGEQTSAGWYSYRAVLVPSLWLLTQSYRSRVFMKKTVKDLVSDVLKEHELLGLSGRVLGTSQVNAVDGSGERLPPHVDEERPQGRHARRAAAKAKAAAVAAVTGGGPASGDFKALACFRKRDTGSCDRVSCPYSHDAAVLEASRASKAAS